MSNESNAPHAHFVQLVDELIQQWQVLAAEASKAGGDAQVHAYLVLNRWADNPVAEAIEDAFPDLARERCAVPDEIFKDRLDRAPCLLPLPKELAPSAQSGAESVELARNTLAQWLAFTWEQVRGRLSRQDLCAVVFSTAKARRIAQQWVDLGTQQPPAGGQARLFRYHDPRVMQRVWPLLTAAQKLAWLGPVVQWWSLEQPWGPLNADEHAQWFQGRLPSEPGTAKADLRRLLDARQWHAAHVSPSANRIWLDYAEHGIAAVDQPPGDVVIRLLADAQRLRLAVRAVAYGQGIADRPAILEEMTEAERRAPRQGRVFATRGEYEAYMAKLRQEGEATMGPRAGKQWDKYSASLDLAAMDDCRKAYAKQAEDYEKIAAQRAADSLAWIKSAALLDALALYNGEGRRSLLQGVRCSAQINGIIEGLGGGGERCEYLLITWARDHGDNPSNLLWRSFLFNQEDAQASLAQAMASAQAPGKSAAEQAQGWKNIIDKFAKYNDLMERHNEMSLRIGKAIPLFGASAVMTETLHLVFRHSAGERGWENKLARGLMASRLAGTGSAGAFDLYVQLQADLKKVTPQELLSKKNYTAAQAEGKLRQARNNAVEKVIAEGGRGEFYKLRLGGAITAVESWLLLAKAKELANAPAGSEEAVRRAVLEFTAASLTTTAATLEIGALMQEWLAAKTSSPAAKNMAHIRLGGFKLAGNALAGVAGAVGAYYDFKDAAKALGEDKYSLFAALLARGFANTAAVGVGVALGLSYAGPLLEYLSKRAGQNAALDIAAIAAKRLAAVRPWLFAATWWLTFATIALSFVIALVSDDAMEKWCARSGFRTKPKPDVKPEPLYAKAGEELTELYGAFQGVSMAQKP